jgi:transcriptional regulator with XRE-family HTH domain
MIKQDKLLAHIHKLLEERNWSFYELEKQSGVAQSTIASWFSKGVLPRIDSCRKIAKADIPRCF